MKLIHRFVTFLLVLLTYEAERNTRRPPVTATRFKLRLSLSLSLKLSIRFTPPLLFFFGCCICWSSRGEGVERNEKKILGGSKESLKMTENKSEKHTIGDEGGGGVATATTVVTYSWNWRVARGGACTEECQSISHFCLSLLELQIHARLFFASSHSPITETPPFNHPTTTSSLFFFLRLLSSSSTSLPTSSIVKHNNILRIRIGRKKEEIE